MQQHFAVTIIGGGIVGLATGLALIGGRRPQVAARDLLLLEAEPRVAAHQTGHNSGVIHSGLYYKPGSLKARLCATGRERMVAFCAEHGLPYERCGKIVVATREDELPRLAELELRGIANGLGPAEDGSGGLRWLTPEALRELEPHAGGLAGLHVPQTGIVDYGAVARKMAELLTVAGAVLRLDEPLRAVRAGANPLELRTPRGTYTTAMLTNCAGLHSDRVARMCGLRPTVRIVPFRGEYYTLRSGRAADVRNLIYPVPDPRYPFLGVHLTRMISGGVEAGPNAVLALRRLGYRRWDASPRDLMELAMFGGFWRMAARHWPTAVMEWRRSLSPAIFARDLARLVPSITRADLAPGGCGVRAQAVDAQGRLVDDFAIMQEERMLHVLNAPSPAATASLAIGGYLADKLMTT